MKKNYLLLFVLFIVPMSLLGQSYRTVHCYDDCDYEYTDTMQHTIAGDVENKLYPSANQVYGFKYWDEILGVDTSRTNGLIIIDLPDLTDMDLNSLVFFLACIDFSCRQDGTSVDSLMWKYNESDFESHIRCKTHGFKKQILPNESPLLLYNDMQIEIFPIPVENVLTIRFSISFSGKLSLLNISGISVFENTIHDSENHIVDLSPLSGTFILNITDFQGKLVKRQKVLVL